MKYRVKVINSHDASVMASLSDLLIEQIRVLERGMCKMDDKLYAKTSDRIFKASALLMYEMKEIQIEVSCLRENGRLMSS